MSIDLTMPTNPDADIANFFDDLASAATASNGYVLEIGVGKGDGSTAAFNNALVARFQSGEDGFLPLHISVDLQQHVMIQKPNAPWWTMVIGDSRAASTADEVQALGKGRLPGVIFIDTDHTYEIMKAELELWSTVAGPPTEWLFHDTYMHGTPHEGLLRALNEFADGHPGWKFKPYKTEAHGLSRMTWVPE